MTSFGEATRIEIPCVERMLVSVLQSQKCADISASVTEMCRYAPLPLARWLYRPCQQGWRAHPDTECCSETGCAKARVPRRGTLSQTLLPFL